MTPISLMPSFDKLSIRALFVLLLDLITLQFDSGGASDWIWRVYVPHHKLDAILRAPIRCRSEQAQDSRARNIRKTGKSTHSFQRRGCAGEPLSKALLNAAAACEQLESASGVLKTALASCGEIASIVDLATRASRGYRAVLHRSKRQYSQHWDTACRRHI